MTERQKANLLRDITLWMGCSLKDSEGWYVETCRERKLRKLCQRCGLARRLEKALQEVPS